MRALLVLAVACATPPPPCVDCLSAEQIYDEAGEPAGIPFAPAVEAWSDGATKRRWIILPPGEVVDTHDPDHWRFPNGTKLVKEFSQDGVRLETRVIETIASTGNFDFDFHMHAYAWRADGSEADLAPEDGASNVLGTDHDIPPRAQCRTCHHSEAGGALGFSAVQLVRTPELAPVVDAPAFAMPGDPTTAAALGFLHANCGHCHADTGDCPPPRLRVFASDRAPEDTAAYATAVGVPLAGWPDHPTDITMRIAPGDPDHSAIVFRASHRGSVDQMPPIATKRVPDDGIATLRAWIAAM